MTSPNSTSAHPPTTAMVLLKHTSPDGSWHYDWMIERPGPAGAPDERRLITFRVLERVGTLDRGFEAERLEDHRSAYLAFEGDIGEGRGRVDRVAAGQARVHEEPGRIVVAANFGSGWRVFTGRRTSDDRWSFAPPEPV